MKEPTDDRRALLVLALLHACVSLAMALLARSSSLPGLHFGDGTWRFALDGHVYHQDALRLAGMLSAGDWAGWLQDPSLLHVRLYSLLYSLLGCSVLSVIPLNTALYVLTAWLVFLCGDILFSRRAALLAACAAACLPSYLLHSTQLLRDSIFIPSQLAVVYASLLLLEGRDRRASVQWAAVAATAGYFGVLYMKAYMAGFFFCYWVVVVLALLLENRRFSRRLAAAVLVLGLMAGMGGALRAGRSLPAAPASILPASPQNLQPAEWGGKFADYRDRWLTLYPGAGSQVGMDIVFRTPWDVVRYIPRALVIGFAAPFPSMWFEEGVVVGRTGRAVSGLETLLMYAAIVLGGVCLWRERRRLGVWMLAVFIVSGVLLHALVITNVGALYRMRYIHWFIILALAARTVEERFLKRTGHA